jgi:hypothetical protein
VAIPPAKGITDDLETQGARMPVAEDHTERIPSLLIALQLTVPGGVMHRITDLSPNLKK